MKAMSFENFKKLFKDSSKDDILKDYYYDYKILMELKEYRLIIKIITQDTYDEPNNENKRFIDEIIEKMKEVRNK